MPLLPICQRIRCSTGAAMAVASRRAGARIGLPTSRLRRELQQHRTVADLGQGRWREGNSMVETTAELCACQFFKVCGKDPDGYREHREPHAASLWVAAGQR